MTRKGRVWPGRLGLGGPAPAPPTHAAGAGHFQSPDPLVLPQDARLQSGTLSCPPGKSSTRASGHCPQASPPLPPALFDFQKGQRSRPQKFLADTVTHTRALTCTSHCLSWLGEQGWRQTGLPASVRGRPHTETALLGGRGLPGGRGGGGGAGVRGWAGRAWSCWARPLPAAGRVRLECRGRAGKDRNRCCLFPQREARVVGSGGGTPPRAPRSWHPGVGWGASLIISVSSGQWPCSSRATWGPRAEGL